VFFDRNDMRMQRIHRLSDNNAAPLGRLLSIRGYIPTKLSWSCRRGGSLTRPGCPAVHDVFRASDCFAMHMLMPY
jgi:hypothetical protein